MLARHRTNTPLDKLLDSVYIGRGKRHYRIFLHDDIGIGIQAVDIRGVLGDASSSLDCTLGSTDKGAVRRRN